MSSKSKLPVSWTPFQEVDEITTNNGETFHPLPPGTQFFKNSIYSVTLTMWRRAGLLTIFTLSIRRNDRAPARDWRDFQRIKNELVGKEIEAIELYPAESRKVDEANQFHLWGVYDSTFKWPFGFTERCVSDGPPINGSPARQRPLSESDGEQTPTVEGTMEVLLPKFTPEEKKIP